MISLNELGVKYGTDKSTLTHHYLYNYERHLHQMRRCNITLLEIGVGNGGSIKMWREWFDDAKVYGIDNNPDCAGEGIFIGDQGNISFLYDVLASIGQPTVIIDDGSHVGADIMQSFKYLFQTLSSDGIYFIEDTHALYSEHYAGKFEANGRSSAYNFFTDLPYHVDVAGRAMCGNSQVAIDWPIKEPPVPEYSRILKAIHHYPSLWVYERK